MCLCVAQINGKGIYTLNGCSKQLVTVMSMDTYNLQYSLTQYKQTVAHTIHVQETHASALY